MSIKDKWTRFSDKILFRKTILNYHERVSDNFGDFEFYLKIEKVYSIKGRFWRIVVPNYFDTDKNLWRLLSRVSLYIHDHGMRYERLEDKLRQKSIWRSL